MAKFYVYRNLHKGGFSIKHRGRVVARHRRFCLTNPELRVSQASQSRARNQKQRNVHAYVVGDTVTVAVPSAFVPSGQLYYNPFKYDTFVDAETKEPLEAISAVYFDGNTAYYRK
jgi:hypothetical protein